MTALKTFEAVARNSSVTKAASELLVTPAAVSQQIKILEQFFGRSLFRRLPRGLVPTEEARTFLIHVSRALEGLLNASQQMRRLEHAGIVRISILPSLATRWFAPRLGRFNRRFPNLQLIIVSDINPVDFSRSDYDLAIRYGSGPYPGLRVDRMMTETLFPVCAPRLLTEGARLKSPADLAEHCLLHELVQPNHPSSEPWLTWQPWLGLWGLTPEDCPNAIRMSDTAAILEAVEEGCGVAIGRSRLMAGQLASGRLVPLFEHKHLSNMSYQILSLPGAADLPSVCAVREWLLDEAEQDYPCAEELADGA